MIILKTRAKGFVGKYLVSKPNYNSAIARK